MSPASVVPALVVVLIAWRIYSRMRRLIGRQTYRPVRLWASVILFPLLALLLALTTLLHGPMTLAALLAGLAAGAALATWGLQLTRFDISAQGFFYTPNAYLGMTLSLLLIARLAYRYFQISFDPSLHGQDALQGLSQSPLTLAVFGLLAGYYATYSAGILRRYRQGQSPPQIPPVPDNLP